jgi:putative endonuclease
MYTLYILLCDNTVFYTGITNNIKKRLLEHKNHDSFFTKKFTIIRMVYQEQYPSRDMAHKREIQIKGWSRAKKMALIQQNIVLLKELSKKSSS